MATFIYQASDRLGKLVKGEIEATNETMVISKLSDLNYYPIKIERQKEAKVSSRNLSFSFPSFNLVPKMKGREVLYFTQQLESLLNAGITLDKGLSIILELIEKRRTRNIVETIYKNVHSGSKFADALAKFPRSFSNLYISMIKAGEAGGVLEVITKRLGEFLEDSQRLKDNIKSALIYPVLLLLVGGTAVTILLLYVVPKFAKIFEDLGQVIPTSTQILLDFSLWIKNYWWLIFLTSISCYTIIRLYSITKNGRYVLDLVKLKIPILGGLIQKIEVARFARTLGTLIQSGVPILHSMNIVKETIVNTVIATSIDKASKGLKEGAGISEPLKRTKQFPPLFIHMVTVGEETGQLEEMLYKIAGIYEKETENTIKRIITLLEPILILVMGIIVGIIIISMLTAIFSVNDIPL